MHVYALNVYKCIHEAINDSVTENANDSVNDLINDLINEDANKYVTEDPNVSSWVHLHGSCCLRMRHSLRGSVHSWEVFKTFSQKSPVNVSL